MNEGVVAMTEEDLVGEIRIAAVDPVHDMMRGAPFRGSVATGPHASAIAGLQRPSRRPADGALCAPGVDDHRLGVEQDPGY